MRLAHGDRPETNKDVSTKTHVNKEVPLVDTMYMTVSWASGSEERYVRTNLLQTVNENRLMVTLLRV